MFTWVATTGHDSTFVHHMQNSFPFPDCSDGDLRSTLFSLFEM